jgi:hypothetical protein
VEREVLVEGLGVDQVLAVDHPGLNAAIEDYVCIVSSSWPDRMQASSTDSHGGTSLQSDSIEILGRESILDPFPEHVGFPVMSERK